MYEHDPVLTRCQVRMQIWREQDSLVTANKMEGGAHLVDYIAMCCTVGNMVAPPHILQVAMKLMC